MALLSELREGMAAVWTGQAREQVGGLVAGWDGRLAAESPYVAQPLPAGLV